MKTKLIQEPDKLFFTSDQHFMHHGVLEFCHRPYRNKTMMGEDFIKKWNDVVPEDGIVYVLGDFCFGGKVHWRYYISKLNGFIYFIPGNHDKSIPMPNKDDNYEVLPPIVNIKVEAGDGYEDRQYITLCHYPMLSWYGSHRGHWQLFGHMHGDSNKKESKIQESYRPQQIDVGVDSWGYKPVSYKEIECLINSRLKASQ